MKSEKILIDTDVLIDFLRKKPRAQSLLEEVAAHHDLYISVVTLAELMAGMRPSEEEATEILIDGLNLLSVTEAIARKAGSLRREGKKVLLPDCLIAATALQEECPLLTFNTKDYPFSELDLLKYNLS